MPDGVPVSISKSAHASGSISTLPTHFHASVSEPHLGTQPPKRADARTASHVEHGRLVLQAEVSATSRTRMFSRRRFFVFACCSEPEVTQPLRSSIANSSIRALGGHGVTRSASS